MIATARKQDRKKRIPLGSPLKKLTASNIPAGKVARWFNDKPGRLDAALDGGYEFVRDPKVKTGEGAADGNEDLGSMVSKVVGSEDSGTPIRAYLMIIDKELYEEDQSLKSEHLDKIDASIRGGKVQNTLGSKGYIPDGGISYGNQ